MTAELENKNRAVKSVQWAPSGSTMSGRPGPVVYFLASDDGKTYGYGWGPGASVMFGHEHGDVTVLAGQWVNKHEDGTFSVTDEKPEGSEG